MSSATFKDEQLVKEFEQTFLGVTYVVRHLSHVTVFCDGNRDEPVNIVSYNFKYILPANMRQKKSGTYYSDLDLANYRAHKEIMARLRKQGRLNLALYSFVNDPRPEADKLLAAMHIIEFLNNEHHDLAVSFRRIAKHL